MFHKILDIIETKRSETVILENVRALSSHDKGKTFEEIRLLIAAAGYYFNYKVLKASDFEVLKIA